RAKKLVDTGGHGIIGGYNYGQGSSREHAALAPRFLGLQVALVKDFARIHWQNLVNFGILPLTFVEESDYDALSAGDVLLLEDIRNKIQTSNTFTIKVKGKNQTIDVQHTLSYRQVEIMLYGGVINWVKEQQKEE
ncbi:MAG TPA: aconitate hydratase, partial [Bacillota bacterium]|nr:aconitate hydratase [Bacillota bacterium]